MPNINISIKNKIATSPDEHIVCGNSDYTVTFLFDEEWAAYDTKTARFIYNGKKEEVVFSGNVCEVPIIRNAVVCAIGVFAGDLHTTTPALVACNKSILCADGLPPDPSPDVYVQLIEMYEELRREIETGSVGNGIPAGGKTGQLLVKKSDADYDCEWQDLTIPEQYGLVTYDQDKTITVS